MANGLGFTFERSDRFLHVLGAVLWLNRLMVVGIVLAAGRSSRMGRSKALLPSPDGRTFVHRLARAFCDGGLTASVIVGRPEDTALRMESEGIGAQVRFVENADADAGQLSSLIAGLRAADGPGVRAVLVAPVDAPLITAHTVARLIAVFSSTGAPIVRAVHAGRHGHPVLFSRAMFDDLFRADPAVGARAVLRAHEGAIVNVDVDDPGVVADVDTPADYRALFGRDL